MLDLVAFGAEVMQQCLALVKATAADCVLSSDWLQLPKPLLVDIISSHDVRC